MHLKGLELHGFKSFPDKINIDFENGITAIVGPNGSGKSNIADAIRWVLGEQSTKTLRGNKMEDVIFDGTSDRKPVGFAEVSLTIDNSDNVLPMEYNEITVSRRYYRSGESEYFINKTPVRLKDINELFMDTGIGKDGYSIIGQGRIAEILSVKSEDRRQIFEEAAGISKYRYRKQEAERKLRSTDENLTRVSDIIFELEERIGPLREQSEKAKISLKLQDEKRHLETNVWLDGIMKTNSVIDKINSDYEISKDGLLKSDIRLTEIEHEIDSLFEKQKNKTLEIESIRNSISETEELIAAANSQIAVLKNDIIHNDENISRIDLEIENEQSRISEIDMLIETRIASASELEVKINELKNELEAILQTSVSVFEKEKQQSDMLVKIREKISSSQMEITELRIKESSLNSMITANTGKLAEINQINTDRTAELELQTSEHNDCDDNIKNNEQKASALANTINGYKLKLARRLEKGEIIRSNHEKTKQTLFEKNQRHVMLSDLKKHYEGFTNSVKSVMEETKKGTLTGIYGPVSTIVATEDKYMTAIETALGGSIQHIVCDNEGDAKSAIYFLKNNSRGRATFLPLSTIKGQTLDRVLRHDGFVGIASELVNFDNKFNDIVSYLLGKVAIVETIDHAIIMAKKESYKFKIVTLDGQIVNAGGSLTGGNAHHNSGLISRDNQIKKLSSEIKELEQSLNQLTQELKEQEQAENEINAMLDGANAENRVLNEELIKERTRLLYFDELLLSINKSLDDNSKETLRIKAEIELNEKTVVNIRTTAEQKEQNIQELESTILKITGTADGLKSEKEELDKNIADKRFEIVSVSKDIETAMEYIKDLEQQRSIQLGSGDKRKKEIDEIKAQNLNKQNEINESSEQIQSLEKKIGDKKEQTQATLKVREYCESGITILRTEEKETLELKNKYTVESERLDAKITSIRAEYDNLIARLWDEYELTLTEALKDRVELESVSKASRRINEIKVSIKALGDVYMGAIEEYKTISERYEYLLAQMNDLVNSCNDLKKIIDDLTGSMKEIFSDQFKIINEYFSLTFAELFGGGTAQLIMNDPSDVLNTGIEIKVAPPGKIIKNLSALSGGEQAFVAIALYFSILKVHPTPFCILDEIEAALDDVNVTKFAEYLRKLSNRTQFISITHRRGTMEEADRLYGITMQEKGVSKLLAINL